MYRIGMELLSYISIIVLTAIKYGFAIIDDDVICWFKSTFYCFRVFTTISGAFIKRTENKLIRAEGQQQCITQIKCLE